MLVFAAVVLLGLVAWKTGILADFASPSDAARTLLAMGGWGYLIFVLAYALLQPFGVPGTVFLLVAPLIWPWPIAFLLSLAGTMGCSVVGFSFARFVARDWVHRNLPARFRRYEGALEHHGFRTVFLLRFFFWMPQMLHAFLGVSRVSFWEHFWGSLAGYLLPIFVVSYFGQRVFDAMRSASIEVWVGLGLAAVTITATWLWWQSRLRARSDVQEHGDPRWRDGTR